MISKIFKNLMILLENFDRNNKNIGVIECKVVKKGHSVTNQCRLGGLLICAWRIPANGSTTHTLSPITQFQQTVKVENLETCKNPWTCQNLNLEDPKWIWSYLGRKMQISAPWAPQNLRIASHTDSSQNHGFCFINEYPHVLQKCMAVRTNFWIKWCIVRSINWLMDGSIDWLMDWSIDGWMDWSIDW